MKIIYILLIFSIWQSTLNSDEVFTIIVSDEPATPISCFSQVDETGSLYYYYGFSFKALTSGFKDNSKTVQFFLGSPYYAFSNCNIPKSEDSEEQTINCYVNANVFPLYDSNPTIQLPTTTENEDGVTIENWNNLLKSPKITFQESCYPDYEYEIKSSLKLYCQNFEGEEYKALIGSATFTKNQQNLRNLETVYTTYIFQANLYVDSEIEKVYCTVTDQPEDEDENSTDFSISCPISGEENAILFPTTVSGTIDSSNVVAKFNVNQKLSLNCNKSSYLSSVFTKFAGLLILYLILF
jgi:hypothetical protein